MNPSEDSFPGLKTIEYVFAKIKKPIDSVKA